MKLFFDKKEDGEIFVQVEGKEFSPTDYIRMVKEIKRKEKIEAAYGEKITLDEKNSVETMLREINRINEEESGENPSITKRKEDDMDF